MASPKTVNELIEELTDLVAAHPAAGDLPLRVAYQPSWPLAGTVAGVRVLPRRAAGGIIGEPGPALWVTVGSAAWDENPYADKEAWEGDGLSLADDYEDANSDEDVDDEDVDE